MSHKTVSTDEVLKLLKSGECQLVDIREPNEFASEAIPGAVNVPLSELQTCNCPASGTLVFHCKSGMRTGMAAKKLAQWAGRDVLILDGGIEAWRRAGGPTSRT